jgi:hypothetical protein
MIDPAKRTELFRKAFDHISERIDKVYKVSFSGGNLQESEC